MWWPRDVTCLILAVFLLASTSNGFLSCISKLPMGIERLRSGSYSSQVRRSLCPSRMVEKHSGSGKRKFGGAVLRDLNPSKRGNLLKARLTFLKLLRRIFNMLLVIGRNFLMTAGRFTARLPRRMLRLIIAGFVKDLKAQQVSLDELHYMLMGQLTLEDIYKLVLNERSLNATAAEYGGLVNFIDAKAKEEAAKILPGLDKNGDGILTADEIVRFIKDTASSHAAIVKANVTTVLDSNGDGQVTPKEVLDFSAKTMTNQVQKMFSKLRSLVDFTE